MYICHPHIFAHSYVPISVYLDISGSYHHPTHTHTHRHANTHSVDKHKLYCTYMIVYCIPTYMYFVADTSNIKWASFVVFHSSILTSRIWSVNEHAYQPFTILPTYTRPYNQLAPWRSEDHQLQHSLYMFRDIRFKKPWYRFFFPCYIMVLYQYNPKIINNPISYHHISS